MIKCKEIEMILEKHNPEIQRRFQVKEIWIFSSYTRKRQKAKSDPGGHQGFLISDKRGEVSRRQR